MADLIDRTAAAGRSTGEREADALVEYHRFVELVAAHPGRTLVPSRDVDAVWHRQLADPVTGAACPRHTTHTTPDRDRRFALTLQLYRQRWGEPGPAWLAPADCQVDDEPPPE